MIQSFISYITETLSVSLVDFALVVYIFKNCIFNPVIWFFKKYGGVIKK